MGAIANAWRAASRRQKVTIVVALLIAAVAVASLTSPSANNQVAQTQPTATAAATTPSPSATPSATATESATETPTFSEAATATVAPTAKPTAKPTARPTPKPTPKPIPKPTATPGPYGNPWGYDFSPGNLIYSPPSAFCSYFPCIASFWTSTNGYVVQCVDRKFSHSGGRQGVCSQHGGYYRTLYSH